MPAVTWQPLDDAVIQGSAIANSITPPCRRWQPQTHSMSTEGGPSLPDAEPVMRGGARQSGSHVQPSTHALLSLWLLSSGFHRYNVSEFTTTRN